MSLENVLDNISLSKLSFAQMRVTRSVEEFNHTIIQDYGMTSVEWMMLSVIAEHSPDGIRVTDVAAIFEVKTTYVTSVLNGLRAKGCIDTRFDPNDARVRLAIVTKTGTKQLALIEQSARQSMLQKLDGVLSARDFEHYASALMRITKL